MDPSKKYKKETSFKPYPKGFAFAFFIVFCTSAIFFGCQSTSKKPDLTLTASNLKDSREKDLFQITTMGTNVQGAYSPKGDRIVFVSSKRNAHDYGQIYELNLLNRDERRITFNSGTDSFPKYHPKEELIVYSSTTDALKENIPIEQLKINLGLIDNIQPKREIELPLNDIYVSSLIGTSIKRLTSTKEFDGDAQFTPDGKKLLFASERDKKMALKSFNFQSSQLENLKVLDMNLRWPSIHYDDKLKKLLGVNYTENKLIVQDVLPEKIDLQTPAGTIFQQPSWHPKDSKIVVSANKAGQTNFDIYVLDVAQQCLQQITFSTALDQDPVFSPDGKSILFTSNRSGSNQLFITSYDASQPCEKL